MSLSKRFVLLGCMVLLTGFSLGAEIHGGFETNIGLVSGKLFGTEQSQYLYPTARTLGSWRLSLFIGLDTGDEDSKFAVGFEQHAGVHLASITTMDHLPLVFSLPSRVYLRFGTSTFGLDLLGGIDNQFVVLGKQKYPAYTYWDIWSMSNSSYAAAPSGYAIAMELGLRVLIKKSYIIAIASLPLSDDYLFPGMVRLGFGLSF